MPAFLGSLSDIRIFGLPDFDHGLIRNINKFLLSNRYLFRKADIDFTVFTFPCQARTVKNELVDIKFTHRFLLSQMSSTKDLISDKGNARIFFDNSCSF